MVRSDLARFELSQTVSQVKEAQESIEQVYTAICRNSILLIIIAMMLSVASCGNYNDHQGESDNQPRIEMVIQKDTVYLPVKKGNESADLLKLYMKTNGSDESSGLSYEEAVVSLERVQQILKYLSPKTDVEIHINQGTYFGQEVEWTYINGKRITFTSIDFSEERPVFDGQGQETWFNLPVGKGENTNLIFRNLTIKNYKLGIGFRGDRNEFEKGWNGNNLISGVRFERIGSLYTEDKNLGYSAINVVNSRGNRIEDSYFIDIENELEKDKYIIHAIYFAHYSSDNTVTNCLFTNNSGDPIRVRDESNFNTIENNIFIKTGHASYYNEWFCSKLTAGDSCTKPSGERSSQGNVFSNNDCQSGFSKDYIPLTIVSGGVSERAETTLTRVIAENNSEVPMPMDSTKAVH